MDDWKYIDAEPGEGLSRLEQFGVKKVQDGEEIDFVITIREFSTPPDPAMRFFAQTDKQTNQKTAPFTPVGWGSTRHDALWECIKALRRFPYQG